MLEKLKSRKFWIAILTNVVSITVVFRQIGGEVGIIAGIIGTIAASISYMITECTVDVARAKVTYNEIVYLLQELKKERGE